MLRRIIVQSVRICLIFFGWLAIVGCDYQFGHGELAKNYSTLSIPYVEGDLKGGLTAEVIKKISISGALRYVSTEGDLILNIKIVELDDENIGFRYDRGNTNHLKKYLIPTETRISALVEVTLTDSKTCQVIRGPTRITASVDFDHSFYSSRNEMNRFSLGQLNDIDAALDAVIIPLNRELADRIVNYIVYSW
ncbi:MAG: LPS assembly lipoprotein LptE [Parachlamydiaceae bacterium]|nr:LPS assembly lipoprotein LptE [Parachlamydiaceae bacterium]